MSEGNKCSNIKRCAENMGSCFIYLFFFCNKLYISAFFANIINLGCIVTAECGFGPVPANTKSVNREI